MVHPRARVAESNREAFMGTTGSNVGARDRGLQRPASPRTRTANSQHPQGAGPDIHRIMRWRVQLEFRLTVRRKVIRSFNVSSEAICSHRRISLLLGSGVFECLEKWPYTHQSPASANTKNNSKIEACRLKAREETQQTSLQNSLETTNQPEDCQLLLTSETYF